MDYIGRYTLTRVFNWNLFVCRMDSEQKSNENEILSLDLHGYLANMVDWLKLVCHWI